LANFKTAKVTKGRNGWGGPLILTPTDERKYVISVTGGGIHPVAQRIAKITGATAVDSFKTAVEKEATLAAVIDCGGTARCGTYPRIGIPTINVKVMSPSGPLAKFMTEDIFVSGVGTNDVTLSDISVNEYSEHTDQKKESDDKAGISSATEESKGPDSREEQNNSNEKNKVMKLIDKIGQVAGMIVNTLYQAGRDTIDTIIKNIIPFMAFVATLIGIVNYTGIGDLLANVLAPLSNNLIGLILLGVITSLPFLSPLLAPGAVIGAVIGTLIGNEIAHGGIDMSVALPALFAINAQVGCDFIPVGLTLGEAKPETVDVAAPSILFSRVITGPLAVVIAYFMSFAL